MVILTLNEAVNIEACLASCGWADDVHVVDSGSTDDTVALAEGAGAKVYHHPFTSFGEQRNWAIDHIDARHDWVFHLDADERFTPELVEEMTAVLASDPQDVDGYHVPQKLMMMGKWLRRAGGYPTYQVRLFNKQRMRFIDHGHGQRESPDSRTAVLKQPYLHFAFSKGVYEWLQKHNRYSTLEALQVLESQGSGWSFGALFSLDRIRRWRAWKEFLYRVPGRPMIRTLGVLLVHGGILEGRAGWTYARLIGMYEQMITIKLRLMRGARKRGENPRFEHEQRPETENAVFAAGGTVDRLAERVDRASAMPSRDDHPEPPNATGEHVPQMQPETSPWSFREKFFRALWMTIGRPAFHITFHNWYPLRAAILRLFGAKIGKRTAIRPSARIEVPWMLEVDDDASIGDFAIVYCLGPTYIGKRAIISQYAHLCAGTHDYTDHTFKLIRSPITIGADVWIGTDTFIGPGVTVGEMTVVGARSSLYKDAEPGKVYVGNPARAIKDRVLR
ncbi:MAG: glycosyltransferase [Planctomycetota bacterium]